MRLTTSSCQLGGIISARMKRWQLSGSTVGYVIGLPAFVDGPVWCRKRSRWSTPPSHCLPPTTSIEQRQNSPCHCLLNTLEEVVFHPRNVELLFHVTGDVVHRPVAVDQVDLGLGSILQLGQGAVAGPLSNHAETDLFEQDA